MKEINQKEIGTLYIVATPIGNLEDITLRAIRVLREADLIAAEDTRHTLKLLNHLEISKPLMSYHRHNEDVKTDILIKELKQGKQIALVSDAGTPGICDPGEEVIKKCIEEEIPIVPIPGACAMINALICSGLDTKEFVFIGFLPLNKKNRKEKLEEIKDEYDYILIDCPPSLGLITLNAFTASDSVLIPVQCEYYALEGLGQLLNTINLVKKHLNKNIQIEGALLTMYDIRTNLSNQVVKEVKKYFDNKVYKTVIPRNVRLSEAPSYGMPITEYDPRSKGAKSYMKFAKEFLKINEEEKKAKHMM